MDKNTILGFVLIAAILIGFSILNKPSEEEIARQQTYNDSIARVMEEEIRVAEQIVRQPEAATIADTTSTDMAAVYGEFAPAGTGVDTVYILENEHLKVSLSSKGGRVSEVLLKEYNTHDSLPLVLFNQSESEFGFTMVTNKNRIINTSDLYFVPVGSVQTDSLGSKITLRLLTDTEAYVDFVYTLKASEYMLDYSVQSNKMQSVLPAGTNSLELHWNTKLRQQEKGRQFEERYSKIHYKYTSDDVESLSESKDDSKSLPNKVKWIAFKDQFFSSVLIAKDDFTSTTLKSKMEAADSKYLKTYTADMLVSYDISGKTNSDLSFYFGPNKYKILNSFDKGLKGDEKLKLTDLIPLGWGIFGWVNKYAIIPMFNLFSKYIGNFGIIILLMTLVIKLVLFPLTYKSYVSSAKMKVLKPEIDEINARIPADKPAERQKATMELYGKVGVSPFSGCLPTLLQMPILFAMFSFFPASIELRQESFLWAKDLSAYDAIVSWNATIPLVSQYFGNHISLFTLLMTIASLVSTKMNMANTATPDQPGAGMMKWMMYLMPIMFMFMFNGYASGLSYYYLVSTLITIIQTYAIRGTIDDKKLLAQLHANRAKKANAPQAKKKSGFMERLEKMQREQQKMMQEQNKKRK